jgi:hypothetical protein
VDAVLVSVDWVIVVVLVSVDPVPVDRVLVVD